MEQKYADIIKLGTSALSDAMDRLGIPGQALGIKPVDRSFLVCGPAFTVHNMPCDIHGGSVGDYIDDVAAGQVICIDNVPERLDMARAGGAITIDFDEESVLDRHGDHNLLVPADFDGASLFGTVWPVESCKERV